MEYKTNQNVRLSGKKLLQLRSQHDMTQEQLELISGVPSLIIDRIEKGSTKFYSKEILKNLATALKITPEDLMDESQIPLKVIVRDTVYNLLIQKKFCTQSDFQEELQVHGIELGNSAVLRVVLTELVKHDCHITRTSRGCYKYDETVQETVQEDFDRVRKAIHSIIKEAALFDWISSSDEDFSAMFEKVKMVRHFYNSITEELSTKEGRELLIGRQ